MRKKFALMALFIVTTFSSSFLHALDFNFGLSSRTLFLHTLGKNSGAQTKLPGKSDSSLPGGILLVGPQLNWQISEDFTLTLGGYFCANPLDYLSTLKLKRPVNVNSQPAADSSASIRRGSGDAPHSPELDNVIIRKESCVQTGSDAGELEDLATDLGSFIHTESYEDNDNRELLRAIEITGMIKAAFRMDEEAFAKYYPQLQAKIGLPSQVTAQERNAVLKTIKAKYPKTENQFRATCGRTLARVANNLMHRQSTGAQDGTLSPVAEKKVVHVDTEHLSVEGFNNASGGGGTVSRDVSGETTPLEEPGVDGRLPSEGPSNSATKPVANARTAPAEDLGALNKLLSGSPIEVTVSLHQHIPIVVGAEYNLYSSDILSFGIFGSIGLGIWTAKAVFRDETIKAEVLWKSEESRCSLVGLGGLKFGLRLGSSTISLSGGYGYFGKPDFKWSKELDAKDCPNLDNSVHGLFGSAEIGFEF